MNNNEKREFSVTFKGLKMGGELSIDELDYQGSEKSFQSIMIFLMSFDPVTSFDSDEEVADQDLAVNAKEFLESQLINSSPNNKIKTKKEKPMSGAIVLTEDNQFDTYEDLESRPSLGKKRS